MWFKCIGCRKLWYTEVNGSSPHVLKFSWHCHLIWPGVNLPWTSLHYAKCSRSEWETGGLDFLSFLVWAWLLDTNLDSTAFFGGISSQATLLVSENKPQILLKCLHVWICAMHSFQFLWLGLKDKFAILVNALSCFLAESYMRRLMPLSCLYIRYQATASLA